MLELIGRQTPAGQVLGGVLAGAGWAGIQWALSVENPWLRSAALSGGLLVLVLWLVWLVSPSWRRWMHRVGKAIGVLLVLVGLAEIVLGVLILTERVAAKNKSSGVTLIVFGGVLLLAAIVLLVRRKGDHVAKAQRAAHRAQYFIVGPQDGDERLAAIEAQLTRICTRLDRLSSAARGPSADSLTWREWWRGRPSRRGRR